MNVANRIKQARASAGFDQAELANAIKGNRVTISKWETEAANPSPFALVAIAVATGVSADWLATGEGPMFREEKPRIAGHTTAPARLAFARDWRGVSRDELAAALNLDEDPGIVADWETGKTWPDRAMQIKICELLGITWNWLSRGELPMAPRTATEDAVAEPLDRPYHSEDPDQIFLPLYETRPAAGPGNHVHRERPATVLPFSRTWLRSIDITPQDAAVLKVEGDSMEPTLRHGEMVFLDTKAAQEPLSAGIWVFSIRGQLFVKRLEPRPDGEVLAHSDNPAYSSFPVDLSHPSFKLIGRVAWAGRRP